MSVTVTNLIQGAATLYNGAYGTATEPADSAVNTAPPASGGWTDCGGTNDGVTLSIGQEFAELEIDQVIDVPARRQTKRDVQIQTNLAEGTLANLKLALNGGTSASGTGYESYTPTDGLTNTEPDYSAVILDGLAPESMRRRVIGRKVLNTENVESAYKKDGQWLIPVAFATHWISASTAPYHVVDAA
ncbi:MAG TPA: hypothetical protein VGD51_08710 [Nocardioidaceae bacterium]